MNKELGIKKLKNKANMTQQNKTKKKKKGFRKFCLIKCKMPKIVMVTGFENGIGGQCWNSD